MANRYSTFSTNSALGGSKSSSQVSTTSLLNALHTTYSAGQPYQLESGSSVVVNTWLTAANINPDGTPGGTVDAQLAQLAWEHARRRAEDGCIVLRYLLRSFYQRP